MDQLKYYYHFQAQLNAAFSQKKKKKKKIERSYDFNCRAFE